MTNIIKTTGRYLMVGTILTSAVAFTPAYAEDTKASETTLLQSSDVSPAMKQERHLLHESRKMLGHINLAAMALDMDLVEEAKADLAKAKDIAKALEKETLKIDINKKVEFGKLSYDYKDTIKDYYVPIYDDVFVLNSYDVKPKGDAAKVVEVDAEIVHSKINIDLRSVNSALDNALKFVNDGKNIEARKALVGVYEGAMNETTTIENPLWAVHDNIMLAENMAQNGEYEHARFALRHAKQELKRYGKVNPSAKKSEYVQVLDGEISTVQAQLNRNTFTAKMKEKMSGWLKELKGKMEDSKK